MGLAEAFADFAGGSTQVALSAGAVDITTIEPRREVPRPPAPPAPPPPPPEPSRIWVQVATGQDLAAFRFDLRRIRRNAGGLLDHADAWTARWGQTNRLLVGPFASAREANELVTALAGHDISTFRFTSREGEEIQPLD